jgi:uncharacterized protein YdhG (YjbR/CyaY superfamily)
MKKKSSRPAKKKASAKIQTVDQYVARVPKAARSTFDQLREVVRSAVPPGSSEIISYGILAFKKERVLVWFAAFSNHCSLFPTNSVIEQFRDELKGFSTSKGTIKFPLDKALPATLIKRIVKARVAQSKKDV